MQDSRKERFEILMKTLPHRVGETPTDVVWRFLESECELARKEEREKFNDCVCQEKWTLGVVHRKDGPCYLPPNLQENVHNVEVLSQDK